MTSPDPKLINLIADRLSRPIPHPKPKPVRRAKTWRTLKPGQRLAAKEGMFLRGKKVEEGEVWEVVEVDSGGALLERAGGEERLRWETAEWKGSWERVRGSKSKPKD